MKLKDRLPLNLPGKGGAFKTTSLPGRTQILTILHSSSSITEDEFGWRRPCTISRFKLDIVQLQNRWIMLEIFSGTLTKPIKLKKSFLPLPHPFLLALDFVIANQVYRDIQTSGEGRDIMFSKNKVVSTEH